MSSVNLCRVIVVLLLSMAASAYADSLVSLWEFNGNWNSSNDASYNLTPAANAQLVSSSRGLVAEFHGGKYQGPDNPNLDRADSIAQPSSASFNSGLTIMGWIDPFGVAQDPNDILSLDRSAFSLDELGFQVAVTSDGSIRLQLRDTSDRRLLATSNVGTVQFGQWQHFAVTWDGDPSGGVQIYLDGVPATTAITFVGNGSFAGLNGGELPVRVGASLGDAIQEAESFNGDIDHLSLWHGALTPEQIGADFAASSTPLPSTLLGGSLLIGFIAVSRIRILGRSQG
jgi:hypothetical protein